MRETYTAIIMAILFLFSTTSWAGDFYILLTNLQGHKAIFKDSKYRIANLRNYPLPENSAVELISKTLHGRDDFVLVKTESGHLYFLSSSIFKKSAEKQVVAVEELNPNRLLGQAGEPPKGDCEDETHDKTQLETVKETTVVNSEGNKVHSFVFGLKPVLEENARPLVSIEPKPELKGPMRIEVVDSDDRSSSEVIVPAFRYDDIVIELVGNNPKKEEVRRAPENQPRVELINESNVKPVLRPIARPPRKEEIVLQNDDQADVTLNQSVDGKIEQPLEGIGDLLNDRRVGDKNYVRLKKVARDAFWSDGWKKTGCHDSSRRKAGYSAKQLENCKRRYYCSRKLNQAYEKGKPIWDEEVSLEERAERIKRHADRTFQKMVDTGEVADNSVALGFSRWTKPEYIHGDLSPNMAVCIAFVETRGTLNPHAINYSFCAPKNTSTAHGLGQMTKSTFLGMTNKEIHPAKGKKKAVYKNLLPITTVSGYENHTRRELFDAINDDVPLQMEVILRLLNHELKFAETSNKMTADTLMTKAVAAYDQDQKSAYLRRFGNCFSCMQKTTKASEAYSCYKKMGK